MLKHLKLKAAMLQDGSSDLCDGDGDTVSSQDTEIVEQLNKDENSSNQSTQDNFIHSTTLSCTKGLEVANSLCGTDSKNATASSYGAIPRSAATSMCHAQTSTSHVADQFVHEETSHMKMKTPPHGSSIHAVHNAYKLICRDPNCHCSPSKFLTLHSPNMEGNCSCFSCLHQTNIPRVVHHTSSVPYLHPNHVVESSPHLHPPSSGVFYSPQHNYQPQKPFFQSAYDHSGVEWSRFGSPAYNAPNINLGFSNPFHSYPPQKLPSTLWSLPNQQGYRPGVSQNLTLPLSRSSIVSLLKRGKCDAILHALDGPLHDESSPLYPIALHTVLEILDVVEKEFANAYRSDRKIKADIHQLTNFVKGMTNVTDSPNLEENVAQTGAEVNTDSLIKKKVEDNIFAAKTFKFPPVKEDEKVLVSDTSEVNNSAVTPTMPVLDNAVTPLVPTMTKEMNNNACEDTKVTVTPSLPTETKEMNENASEGPTIKVADHSAEDSKYITNRTSTEDKQGSNGSCESTVISMGANNEENTSVKELTEVENISEKVSHQREVEKDTSQGSSSINCKNYEQDASAEGARSSGATESQECDHGKNGNGSNKEKAEIQTVEDGGNEFVSSSQVSTPPMPVLENELKLQELSVGREAKNDDRPLDSDVDALLDQTLMEADQAKSKEVHKIAPSTSVEDPPICGSSNYRGKGYKVRAVSNSDKQVTKVKAPVKTFAQIREQHSPLISGSKSNHNSILKADQNTMSSADCVAMPTKDLNGNIVEVTGTSTEVKFTEETRDVNIDIVLREGTPELGRCPSNPLSPSHSDSLDSTDFKSFLEKSKGRTSTGSVSNENVDSHGSVSKSSNSALALLDQMRKLPLPKDPIKQGSSGKPLISKSFHGKLLLQKHSKDDPHPIPLEISDTDFIPRDPRLSLSNLMESKVNYEFSLLEWEDNQSASMKLNPKTAELLLNQSAINVRDPRIRRRLSEDVPFPVLNGSAPPSLGGLSVLSTNFAKVKNFNLPEVSKSIGQKINESLVKENKSNVLETGSPSVSNDVSPSESLPPKGDMSSILNGKTIGTQFDISKSERSSRESQSSVKENVIVADVITSLGIKTSAKSNGDQVVQNTSADSFEHEQHFIKSAIHSIRKKGDVAQLKKKEIPAIASTVSSCNVSEIDKMDTVISFREALDVLKEIKSELKKDLEKCGSKIEKIGKDKTATLGSKVKLLRQTCEVGLLSTEVQKKKATGKKLRDLCGLLEDHFILIADLTVLGIWLKTGNSDVNDCREGLPEFRKGVFTRRSVPCFKKLGKWLKNRYKLDGFENDKLFKLVSMISQSGGGKRSRSRSSSTGSGKHKRKKVRTASHDDGKGKKKHSKKSDHSKDPSGCHKNSGVESPIEEQRKRAHSPDRKLIGTNSKKLKKGCVDQEKAKSEAPCINTSSESDSSSEIQEQSPSTKSGSASPGSETEKPSQEVGKNASKQKVHESVDDQFPKEGKSEGSPQRKQSVSVNSGIQDIQEDMEEMKKKVLNVYRKRSTSSANRCLEELTEISHKAHTQLDDENKTYTSLKNVSVDTKAKFHDVIKGIQRIIVDCEVLVYSLSSSATKGTARETKDKIWQNAQKSSHKPSHEEELALLLSLRKSYLHSDLWRYIKTDVDERIGSLQKKCRSRDSGSQRCTTSSMDYASIERPTSWINTNVIPSHVNEQMIKETRLETPHPVPVADYERRPEVSFHGPGAPFSIDYHESYLTASDRNNLMEFPKDVFSPPSNRPFVRDGYHPSGTGVPREPYQPMTSFLPRDDHIKFDWRRKYDDDYDTWGSVRRNARTTDVDYGGRYFTPPPAI